MPHGMLLNTGTRGGKFRKEKIVSTVVIIKKINVTDSVYVINLSLVINLILPFINI